MSKRKLPPSNTVTAQGNICWNHQSGAFGHKAPHSGHWVLGLLNGGSIEEWTIDAEQAQGLAETLHRLGFDGSLLHDRNRPNKCPDHPNAGSVLRADENFWRCVECNEPLPIIPDPDVFETLPHERHEFYILDTRSVVGNCALFWGKDGKGYTCDLAQAGLYTWDEASSHRDTDVPVHRSIALRVGLNHVRKEDLRRAGIDTERGMRRGDR